MMAIHSHGPTTVGDIARASEANSGGKTQPEIIKTFEARRSFGSSEFILRQRYELNRILLLYLSSHN